MPDYSGMWIDHADGGKVVIAFTGTDPVRNAALRGSFAADSGLLEFREVQWSDRELQALYDQLSDGKAALQAKGLPVVSVSIGESVNAIVLQVTQELTPAQWAELNSQFPGAPLRTELVAGAPVVEACTKFYCDPPLRGGIDGYQIGRGSCTLSFSGYNASGSRYMISVAHCYDAEAVVTQGGGGTRIGGVAAALYGNVIYNGLQFGVDAVRVFVESPSYWRGQNGIYHSTMTNLLYHHVGYYAEPSHTGDLPLHPWPDLTSDTRCGDSEVRYQDGEGSLKRMFRVDVCGSGGDSGGPYYTRWEDATPSPTTPARRAFGIHHGGNTLACSDPADKSLAAHIGPTQQGIEVTVDVTA
jgi:hypothetical protein